MLSAARKVLIDDHARSSITLGDQSLFLSPEDDAMRWFLLSTDNHNHANGMTKPPFEPRQYPLPQVLTETGEDDCQRNTTKIDVTTGTSQSGTGVRGQDICERRNRVCFHSPPKAIFTPTMEVCHGTRCVI